MAEALRIGVVPGVSADKWVRVWRERMPGVPLEVVPVHDEEAASSIEHAVHMVFARLPVVGEDISVIPLWEETPVVVAAKDHPIRVVDSVTVAELEDEELYPGWDEGTLDIVAAGHGIARMPQSVFRATGRRDLVAREVTDAEPTRVGLAWRATSAGPLVDEFIGIVRGRTANSSRGLAATPTPPSPRKERATPRPRPKGGRRRKR